MIHVLQNPLTHGLRLWFLTFYLLAFYPAAQAQAWQPVGPDDLAATWPSNGAAYFTSLAMDATGTPYVVYMDFTTTTNKATVKKYNGTNWVTVGSTGFTANDVSHTTLALDAAGTPYVAYQDGIGGKATVKKFDGSSWVTVGLAGFSAGTAGFLSIAIDSSGTPYVAYADGAYGSKATVQKYNGSSWETVGSPGFSGGAINNLAITISPSGMPYVVTGGPAGVMRYDGSNWVTTGGAGYGTSAGIACDAAGMLYVAYADGNYANKITVKKYNGSNWVAVGSPGFSAGSASQLSMDIDAAGVPFVAYQDGPNGKATVMKFNGNAWATVGSAGVSPGMVMYLSLALDASGTPHLAFTDRANLEKATVMKYNGSSWMPIGRAGFSGALANDLSLVLDAAGSPYAAYQDWANAQKATVVQFDGSNWVPVGNAGFSAGQATYTSLTIDAQDTLYITYSDGAYGNKVTVKKYNGSSWVTVGYSGFTMGAAAYLSLALDAGGVPYVAYQDIDNNQQATVAKYDGVSWVTVGGSGFSVGEADNLSLAIDASGTPYVAYADALTSFRATVMKFDGSNWVAVGNTGFSANMVFTPSLVLDSTGTPYVGYQDFGNNSKATVMKFDGSNWVALGGTGFSSNAADYFALDFDRIKGTLYVAYREAIQNGKATVKKFVGGSWVTVGSTGFSKDEIGFTALKISRTKVYMAYTSNWAYARAFDLCANPGITDHPDSASICAGSGTHFTVAATFTGTPHYQWQFMPPGGIFEDIAPGAGYSGATSATLGVANVTGLDGFHYRCLVASDGCVIPSDTALLSVGTLPTNVPAVAGTTLAADAECTDGDGWTHYYNTIANEIVLSLHKGSNNMGRIGSGLTVTAYTNSNWSNASATAVPPGNNYVVNTGWQVMNRWWQATSANQPTSNVPVRFYYTQADLDGVKAATGDANLVHTQLRFFKINAPATGNPSLLDPTSGHAGIYAAAAYDQPGYWEYAHGSTVSTTTWADSVWGNGFFAEYQVATLGGGGGAGAAPGGSSALWVTGLEDGLAPVSFWPNPASETIHLSATPGTVWSLCDLTGRQLMQGILAGEDETLNIAHLPTGVYVLRAGNAQARVVKE